MSLNSVVFIGKKVSFRDSVEKNVKRTILAKFEFFDNIALKKPFILPSKTSFVNFVFCQVLNKYFKPTFFDKK
jgi:hypothetical protein